VFTKRHTRQRLVVQQPRLWPPDRRAPRSTELIETTLSRSYLKAIAQIAEPSCIASSASSPISERLRSHRPSTATSTVWWTP
jgi:hypothetical protein